MILDFAARTIRLAQHSEVTPGRRHAQGEEEVMKKFVNKVDDVLTEALNGFGAAHG